MPEHYPIEITPPDLLPYRAGNAGVEYVHILDSGKPGPSVMVQALTHGNEFCGAIALDFLLREKIRPAQGKLALAFANVAAFARFDFDHPNRSRFVDEDYNRVWADEVLNGSRDSVELRRARELRKFVDAADYLLDLHSMHEPCRPIMVCAKSEKSVALSRRMGVPADLLLDTGHAAGLRMIERGPFADPASPRTAILIECGQHWEKSAVDVAIDTTLRFLTVTAAVEEAWAKSRLRLTPPPAQRLIRVTEAIVAQSMNFRFARPWKGLEVVPEAGTPVACDGAKEWRTPYDNCVLVMPGTTHLKPGNTTVRLGRYEQE
jgi:predicted deacylase